VRATTQDASQQQNKNENHIWDVLNTVTYTFAPSIDRMSRLPSLLFSSKGFRFARFELLNSYMSRGEGRLGTSVDPKHTFDQV
jgi:hypothetical protein